MAQLPVFLDFSEGVIQDSAYRISPGALHIGQSSYGLGALSSHNYREFDEPKQGYMHRTFPPTICL